MLGHLTVTVRPGRFSVVQADGTVGWWRALDADAAPLLDGPVYAAEDPPVVGGIEVSSLTLSDGQVLTGTFRYQAPKAAA